MGKAVFDVAKFVENWTAVPFFSTKEARVLGVEPEGTTSPALHFFPWFLLSRRKFLLLHIL